MDPEATLKELRDLYAKIQEDFESEESNGVDQEDANRLAELSQALDEWITKGGFLPKDWRRS